jgi:hypothetical protein
LRIGAVLDRVLASALHRALKPFLDSVFLDGSHGFRPRRNPWTMLAALEAVARAEGRWVLVNDDIGHAFGSVPTAGVIDAHRHHIQDADLMRLTEAVLRGHEAEGRITGIDQGSPYSPTAMNVFLHHAHDLAFQRDHHPPWLRYADNHVYLCQDVPEGHQTRQHAVDLLSRAGLTLKGEGDPVVDLRTGAATSLLGFTLRIRGDHLSLGLAEEAWDALTGKLVEAHTSDNPPRAARAIALGWLAACGPALESGPTDVVRQVLAAAARKGFREIAPANLQAAADDSLGRWRSCRNAASAHRGPTGTSCT